MVLGQPTGASLVGCTLGHYRVVEAIGAGGMGQVYRARDEHLHRDVAIKVLPAGGLRDEDERKHLRKEALALSRLNHPSIETVFDFDTQDGVDFIVMEYIPGTTLSDLVDEGPLPEPRILELATQLAEGLASAHDAGVIHRDLKPGNLRLTPSGRLKILDYGLAALVLAPGDAESTMTAFNPTAVAGTLPYMAPEQLVGGLPDERTDLYACGVVLYEMATGRRPFRELSVAALTGQILQASPPRPTGLTPALSPGLEAIILRCLEKDPTSRYASAAALLEDIRRVAAGLTPVTAAVPVSRASWKAALTSRRHLALAFAGLSALLVLGAVAFWAVRSYGAARGATAARGASAPVVSLAVLPFRNATGDPALDSLGSSLSDVLATELGEASHIRTVPSVRVREVLRDLRVEANADLSPADLTRIADFVSARCILWGQFVRFGESIRIDATLQNLDQQATTPLKASAASQEAMLTSVAQLAGAVQKAVAAGSADVLKELQASAWRPSTQSFEALRLYNEGLNLSRDGNHQGALKQFEAAIGDDANFALAYSALAQTYANLGYDAQATQQSHRAIGMSESLPPQERYLIAATHYRIMNDNAKGIETYEKLLKLSPNNARLQFDLAGLYEGTGDLARAQDHFAKAVALDPKHVEGLTAVGRIAIKRGDPKASFQPLNNALSLSIQLKNDEARANVLQAIGVAYKLMGQPADALKQYQESLAIKRQIGQRRGMAVSLMEIASIQDMIGSPQEAVKSYNEALALQREIGDKSGTSLTLIGLGVLLNESLGRPADALPRFREALSLSREAGDRGGEALALNNIGSAYFAKGEFSEAQTYFERALNIREQANVPEEMANTLHNLGETLSRMGKYDQALTRYLRALDLRRADGDTRMAAIESYSIGTIFDDQGRYGGAAKAKGEALQVLRDLKQRDVWLSEMLGGSGYSLALSGRAGEAAKHLDEALALTRELRNSGQTAQVLRFQAENAFWKGDATGAAQLAGEAVRAASRASDPSLGLRAQFIAANISAASQPAKAVAATFAQLGRRAEGAGLTYLSVSCAIQRADALLRAGDRQQARELVEQTLARAETLGLRELQARSEYVLAATMRLAGDPQARRHYASALQVMDDMKREDGNQTLLDRADLKVIHAECVRWSKAP